MSGPAWRRTVALVAGAAVLAGCASWRPGGGDPMRAILEGPELAAVVAAAPDFRLQAVLGLIEPAPGGRGRLVQHGFRLGEEYFYPASTVKMFAAVAAMELLADLRRETGRPVGLDTPMVYHPQFEGEEEVREDPTNVETGAVTVGHEIRKLFLVSDNEAFNRLYELVGQDRLARSLERAGLPAARIVHRLSEARTAEENRRFPRIDFVGEGWELTIPERTSEPLPAPPPIAGIEVGRAFVSGDETIEQPLDFTEKNRIALADLQRGLCMVVRPDVDCGGPGFRLSQEDRDFLLKAMSQLPRESENPVYDPAEVPDDYVKFLLPGIARVLPPERIAIYNKIGQAYGFTTENAWVVDRETGRSFFLAATIYTNADGVLNDDRYDYQAVAVPFFADLGEAAARRAFGDR